MNGDKANKAIAGGYLLPAAVGIILGLIAAIWFGPANP